MLSASIKMSRRGVCRTLAVAGCLLIASGSAIIGAPIVQQQKVQQDDAMNETAILTRFRAFYASSVATLPDKMSDRLYAKDLIDSPPLPPTIRTVDSEALRERLAAIVDFDALCLYGEIERLPSQGPVRLIEYQGLLSGGVVASIDIATDQVLLIWLLTEG